MNKYVELAKQILNLNLEKDIFVDSKVSLDECISISNEFYNYWFLKEDKISVLNNKITIVQDRKLKSYDGKCMTDEFNLEGANHVTIKIPHKKSIKRAITITHEKAHAYHFLNNKQTSEVIPSFLDYMLSKELDKIYKGIKNNNLNYKITEVKKAALIYLKYANKNINDELLVHQINYMLDFINTFVLTIKYEEDSSFIKNIIKDNIFSDSPNNELHKILKSSF